METIYAHLDSTTTVGQSTAGAANRPGLSDDFDNPDHWGQLVRSQGRTAIYERDFGNGIKLVIVVNWA